MNYKPRSSPGWPILLFLLILGGIIGGWLGDALVGIWPVMGMLGKVQSVGIPTFNVDLTVFSFTIGFMLHISLFTILGFLLSYLVYRKLQ